MRALSFIKNPAFIATAIIVIAFAVIGVKLAHHEPSLRMADNATSTSQAAFQIPDYSVTSSPAIQHEDELDGQVAKTIYRCAGNRYFTVRAETDLSRLGKVEVFLKDYSKVLLTQAVTDSPDVLRYQNKGNTFVFVQEKDGGAFIYEGGETLYGDCVATR